MSLKSLSLGVGISAFLSGGFMAATQKANSEFQKMGAEIKKLSQHNKALQNFDLKKRSFARPQSRISPAKTKIIGIATRTRQYQGTTSRGEDVASRRKGRFG